MQVTKETVKEREKRGGKKRKDKKLKTEGRWLNVISHLGGSEREGHGPRFVTKLPSVLPKADTVTVPELPFKAANEEPR